MKPTYLYIKQHTVTGKLYFGKSNKTEAALLEYHGSGQYWNRHINKYGKEHVVTLWYELFDNIFDLVSFAISFSNKLDIVNSSSWANMRIENGLDGQQPGFSHSDEAKLKISIARKSRTNNFISSATAKKISETQKGKPKSDETRKRMSEAAKLRQRTGSPRKGCKLSEETKQKIREARLGKTFPRNKN